MLPQLHLFLLLQALGEPPNLSSPWALISPPEPATVALTDSGHSAASSLSLALAARLQGKLVMCSIQRDLTGKALHCPHHTDREQK